jgi:hypothetical protein
MKKLMMALLCGLVLAPAFAWGQKWIQPYTDKDGVQVEGHWQTPEDVKKERYSTPGKINPYTGQLNPFTGERKGPPRPTPAPTNPNSYYPQPDYGHSEVTPANPAPPAPGSPTPVKQNPYYPQPDYRYPGR